jgi:hypothetical protein
MAWSDAARAAALEARKRRRSKSMESRYYKLDRWYDRSTRSWVVAAKFKGSGNLSSVAAIYSHGKKTARGTKMNWFQKSLAQELREMRGGYGDPRGGRFVPKKKFRLKLK